MDKILLDPLDKLTTAVFAITLSFTFCGLFLLPNARSILSNLLAASIIFGLINLIVNKQNNIGLIDRKILWVFLAYALFTLVNRFVHGDQFGIMRGLIYVVLFGFLIPRKTIIISVTRYSILAGGIGIGLLSLYQQHKGIYRVDGFTNAIMYSQASLVLLILNIVSYKELNGRLEKVLAAVSFTGCLFSLYASQSRGVWLALLFILVMAFILALIKNPVKYILIGVAAIITLTFVIPRATILQNRVYDSISDLRSAENGQFQTSWGLRIVAWKSAWLGFVDNPLMGVGTKGFNDLKIKQVKEHLVSPLVLTKELFHAHNQYLQNLLIKGVFGGLLLLAILFVPLWNCYVKKRSLSIEMLIPISFAIFCLSDVPFEHQNSLYLYTLTMLLIIYKFEADFNPVMF